MESRRVTRQLLVLMMCFMMTTLARMMSSSLPEDDDVPTSLGVKRDTDQEDISKLLLKHLRFRDLSDMDFKPPAFGSSTNTEDNMTKYGPGQKRKKQRKLINNLAALLSDLRGRQAVQSVSNMRMPSLRFGK